MADVSTRKPLIVMIVGFSLVAAIIWGVSSTWGRNVADKHSLGPLTPSTESPTSDTAGDSALVETQQGRLSADEQLYLTKIMAIAGSQTNLAKLAIPTIRDKEVLQFADEVVLPQSRAIQSEAMQMLGGGEKATALSTEAAAELQAFNVKLQSRYQTAVTDKMTAKEFLTAVAETYAQMAEISEVAGQAVHRGPIKEFATDLSANARQSERTTLNLARELDSH